MINLFNKYTVENRHRQLLIVFGMAIAATASNINAPIPADILLSCFQHALLTGAVICFIACILSSLAGQKRKAISPSQY